MNLGRMPYILATCIYREGVECDAAAAIIRQRLPQFFGEVKHTVKVSIETRGLWDYDSSKERTL